MNPERYFTDGEERTPDQILRGLASDVRRVIRYTTIIFVVLGLLVAGGVAFVYVSNRESDKTHDALCTYRNDLQIRLDQTRDYLQKHPEGFPGVSNATLTQSIRNQQSTLDALQGLGCPTPSPESRRAKAKEGATLIRSLGLEDIVPANPEDYGSRRSRRQGTTGTKQDEGSQGGVASKPSERRTAGRKRGDTPRVGAGQSRGGWSGSQTA